jgi:hypothetical protein
MIKQILIVLSFWLLAVACYADVVINDSPQAYVPRVAEVLQHIERKSPGYTVAIDFQGLPQPLKPVQATVTVTCDRDTTNLSMMYGLGLEFGFYRDQIDWVGERKVSLGDQLQAGDVRTIPIKFTLLQSQGILIIRCGSADQDLPVGWCFDENGRLVHLGISPPICDNVPTVFFEGDSLKMPTPGPPRPKTNLVDAYYTVVPPFRVGDTSTVCFHLTALHSFLDGFDMQINYGHMSLVGVPEAVKGQVSAGQTLDICVQVVPLAFREQHEITLVIKRPDGPSDEIRSDEFLPIVAYFSNDGSLMYVHNRYLDLPEEKLSKGLPEGTRETCGAVVINRNPDVTE